MFMLGFDFRVARIVWTVFLVALLLYVTYTISATVLVLVFAVFFSYLVYPLVEQVERVRPAGAAHGVHRAGVRAGHRHRGGGGDHLRRAHPGGSRAPVRATAGAAALQ
jgi:hypothetical protein